MKPYAEALAVTFADVQSAADRIAGHALRTPVMRSRSVDARTGAQVHFKCENLQRMGAFKFRGAFNALSRLSPEARVRGVNPLCRFGGVTDGIGRAEVIIGADLPTLAKAGVPGLRGLQLVLPERAHQDTQGHRRPAAAGFRPCTRAPRGDRRTRPAGDARIAQSA